MNKIWKTLVAVAAVMAFSWGQLSFAQDDGGVVPVEWYACDFEDGKDLADLEKVNAKFNQWADKNDPGYSAWLMFPNLHSGVDYDFGWLGSWPSGAAFGKGTDAFMENEELWKAFAEVIDCSASHELASSAVINAPAGPPANGVVIFAGCTNQDGKNMADSYAAHKELAATMTGMGSKASSWLFYPGLGSNVDFDYWQVIGFNNYAELGAATDIYTNGGGWEKAAEILAPAASCGGTSVWDARLVRAGQR